MAESKLPERVKRIVRRLYLEGYSRDELAALYGLSPYTIKNYVKGVRKRPGRRSKALINKLKRGRLRI